MELYIGGCGQEKQNYVLETRGAEISVVWNDFHQWFRERLIASEADRVERVICGIGQRLK